MRNFKHLKMEQRYQIEAMLAANFSVKKIAAKVGKHPSTIYREIKRGKEFIEEGYYDPRIDPDDYFADLETRYSASSAQEFYDEGREAPGYLFNTKWYTKEWNDYVKPLIGRGWSPELISGRLKKEGKMKISYQTIYRGIRELGDPRCSFLLPPDPFYANTIQRYRKRYQGRKRKYISQTTKKKTMISERPEKVNTRAEFGHWERDLFYGKREKEVIIAFVERKTRYTVLKKLNEATSKKRVRRYIPKKTSIENLKESELTKICKEINRRPMKLHDYYSPLEVYSTYVS